MKLSISEIVDKAIDIPNRKEKIEWLKKNDSTPIRTILRVMYDKQIEVLLPNSAPPYKENPAVDIEGMLYKESRRIRIFVKGGGYDNLNQSKRELLFISLLEDIDKGDAKLLVKMILQKQLTGLPYGVICEAYPGLLPDNKELKGK